METMYYTVGHRRSALDDGDEAEPNAGFQCDKGKPVRPQTLSIIRQTAARLST